MRLPEELLAAIQHEIENAGSARLSRASAALSRRYKDAEYAQPIVASNDDRAAYLAVRVPATYAATSRVFSELRLRAPSAEVTSVLDLAAGPGTAMFAAAAHFPALTRASLVE